MLTESSLVARNIGQCRRLVLGTPAYFARAGVLATPGEMVAHQAVIYSQAGGGDVWTFRQGTSQTSVTVGGRVHMSAAEGLRAAVLADMGLAIASEWMFTPELASGAVTPVLMDWSLPPLDLWAVYPTGRLASAKARAFAAFVEACLREGAVKSAR